MNRIVTCGLFFCVVHKSLAEESFCGNKCYGQGVVVSRSCRCDVACSTVYDDCCSDAKYLDRRRNTTRVLSCKREALVVRSCLEEWKGPDFIAHSCEQSHDYEMDPVGNSPVTSEATGVTYNNYYCAICNGDAENLVVWNIKVSCPLPGGGSGAVDGDDAFRSIFYSYATNEWGYVAADNATAGKSSFRGCAVTSEIPEAHASLVRGCGSGEVGRCPGAWKRDAIREMCSSYTDPVYGNGTRYRNLYCAVCNGADVSALRCGGAASPRNSERRPESDDLHKVSFSLLLDINFSEGNSVGRRPALADCRRGEIFDPFARRCRNIVCGIPGYVMQDGLCTAEAEPPLPL